MTPERAKALLAMAPNLGDDVPMAWRPAWKSSSYTPDPNGLTPEEDAEVKRVWSTMSDSSWWRLALEKIAKGEAPVSSPPHERLITEEASLMRILISNSPTNLQAAAPDVTVEAEYGDVVVTGRLLTMAHHGPRAGGQAPCSYPNGCAPGAESIGLSHVDLDTIGGVMAVLGTKPDVQSFWDAAEFVDLNGPHQLTLSNTSALNMRRLHAYWAFNERNRVYGPRNGSVEDVTGVVLVHTDAVTKILSGNEDWLRSGDRHAADEHAANDSSYLEAHDGVILRKSSQFVNHLYVTPAGRILQAVVTWNPGPDLSGGAITMSLASPVEGINVAELLRELFGPEAGGHALVGGSPRGIGLDFQEACRAASVLRARLRASGVLGLASEGAK